MKLILQAIKAILRKIKVSIDRAEATANNAQDTANNAQDMANKAASLAVSKMSATNPVGSGTFSMGRKSGSAVGSRSHTEGYNTTASGSCSHAEGNNTVASGIHSHAEGSRTTASGQFSHSEGDGTVASGDYSHAEGKHNIKDTSNTYAHIVGNGSFDNKRSNAHTLDWSGNAWFSGDVYVGSTSGTNKDAGSKKLATEEYVDNKASGSGGIQHPTNAEVGQIVVVKSVDENGKPTELGAEDKPDALPNPNALTFTGAVTGSYDGSAPLSVNIPSGGDGGGGGDYTNVIRVLEEVSDYAITDIDPSEYSHFIISWSKAASGINLTLVANGMDIGAPLCLHGNGIAIILLDCSINRGVAIIRMQGNNTSAVGGSCQFISYATSLSAGIHLTGNIPAGAVFNIRGWK